MSNDKPNEQNEDSDGWLRRTINLDALAAAMHARARTEDGDVKQSSGDHIGQSFQLASGVLSKDGTVGLIALGSLAVFGFLTWQGFRDENDRMLEIEATVAGVVQKQEKASERGAATAAAIKRIEDYLRPPPQPPTWYQQNYGPRQGAQNEDPR